MEERLRFYDDGVAPRKNATVMAEAMEKFKEAGGADAMEEGDAEMAEPEEKAEPVEKPRKKKKKRSAVWLSATCARVQNSCPKCHCAARILLHLCASRFKAACPCRVLSHCLEGFQSFSSFRCAGSCRHPC